jgi:hypothetical protein
MQAFDEVSGVDDKGCALLQRGFVTAVQLSSVGVLKLGQINLSVPSRVMRPVVWLKAFLSALEDSCYLLEPFDSTLEGIRGD